MRILTVDGLQRFLNKYSHNYGRVNNISFLAKGGENSVFTLEPFVPVETVARVSTENALLEALEENQILRLVAHSDYVSNILEEIIIYDINKKMPVKGVTLVE